MKSAPLKVFSRNIYYKMHNMFINLLYIICYKNTIIIAYVKFCVMIAAKIPLFTRRDFILTDDMGYGKL
jgi:hypothetical protein